MKKNFFHSLHLFLFPIYKITDGNLRVSILPSSIAISCEFKKKPDNSNMI